MTSINRISRKKPNGERYDRWRLDYVDTQGVRRRHTFEKKKDAEAAARRVISELEAGTHVADRATITFAEASKRWLRTCSTMGMRGRPVADSTLCMYRYHVDILDKRIGIEKLTRITVAAAKDFVMEIYADPAISNSNARKIVKSFKSVLKHAAGAGLVSFNAADGVPTVGRDHGEGEVEIPSRDEVTRILAAAKARKEHRRKDVAKAWRRYYALLYVAALTGMRMSEIRGLPWSNVDFKSGEIHIRQRADENNRIGPPKSSAGRRNIPMSSALAAVLKEWKVACGNPDGLVFANGQGNPEALSNIHRRCWNTCLLDAKITNRYTPHHLRHFHASRLIAQGVSVVEVMKEMGHSSVQMTLGTYGHLLKDDADKRKARADQMAAELGL